MIIAKMLNKILDHRAELLLIEYEAACEKEKRELAKSLRDPNNDWALKIASEERVEVEAKMKNLLGKYFEI